MIESTRTDEKPALEGGVPVRDRFLPFHRSIIGEEEIREVTETLRSGWLTTGPRTKRFEREFAAYVGAERAIGLNSCTAGIHLALVAAGIGPGDEVLMPAVSFPCTANMVVHQGATPVFVDVERDTLNLDTERLGESMNERTRAVIVVHFAGHPATWTRCWKRPGGTAWWSSRTAPIPWRPPTGAGGREPWETTVRSASTPPRT